MTLSFVCVCVCVISVTHNHSGRHITLQMTLLDGDGPFKYSTLMQSAVNTLNQAAEQEAAYPSSLPIPPSFPIYRYLFLPLSWSLFHLLFARFTAFVSFSMFFYPLSGPLPFRHLYLKALHADPPQSLSSTDFKLWRSGLPPPPSTKHYCPLTTVTTDPISSPVTRLNPNLPAGHREYRRCGE